MLVHNAAIRVTCTVALRTPDNDLIVPGTPGTLLRWATTDDPWGEGPDMGADDYTADGGSAKYAVVVAFDAYLFVDSTRCASRHCSDTQGINVVVDYNNLRYLGAGKYSERT
jgi:hypothetical protein